MRALAIVAHPDDETLWMGNQILKNKYDWTILSLCRANDKDRHPKFLNVCSYYNAKPIITNLEDDELKPVDIKEIMGLIDKNLNNKDYDVMYTHGKKGEYGHIRHKEVHQAVKEMIKAKKLKTKKIFYFNYKKQNNHCIAIKNKGYYFKLNDNEIKEKKKIIMEMYGFQQGSFEEKSCGDESFEIDNIVCLPS